MPYKTQGGDNVGGRTAREDAYVLTRIEAEGRIPSTSYRW